MQGLLTLRPYKDGPRSYSVVVSIHEPSTGDLLEHEVWGPKITRPWKDQMDTIATTDRWLAQRGWSRIPGDLAPCLDTEQVRVLKADRRR